MKDPGLWNFGPTHISARLLYAPFCEWPLNSPMTILSTSQLLLVQRKGARRISRLPTVSPTRPSSLMDNGRLAFVRAHVGGKGGFGARVETFFPSSASSAPRAPKACCSRFPARRKGRRLRRAISSAPSLVRASSCTTFRQKRWLALRGMWFRPSRNKAAQSSVRNRRRGFFFVAQCGRRLLFRAHHEALGSSASFMQRITE